MKSLKLSLALAACLGLSSVALADNESCGSCGSCDSCCGHGLLSKLKLHRCSPCGEACPAPCPAPCDGCGGCGGHKLMGMLKCFRPKCGGCCEAPKCEPKPCAPKCEAPCGSCHPFGGVCGNIKGMFHGCGSCCEAPKPACDSCGGCGGCGHKWSLSKLLGKRCCGGCEGSCSGTTEPPASNGAPVPAPAPKPMGAGASSNGLLILTPAG